MEVLLALAGITGLAVLLQSKSPLPSEADYKKATATLMTTPEDPDANTVVGKYIAFVLGDYPEGMKYLEKSSDKTLRTLAQHERAPLYADTPPKKVGMGDEWVSAAKSSPALFRIFYDRASQWYMAAWPDLDGPWKDKLRDQGTKLAVSRPSGSSKKGLPVGWKTDGGAVLDGTVSRVGSYSVKVITNPKQEQNLKSDPIPVTGSEIEYSAWVRSEGTDSAEDQLFINFFDKDGRLVGFGGVNAQPDLPFWNHLIGKIKPPANAATMKIGAAIRSKKGTYWIDDLSLKIDGKEVLKNGSFEEK